VKAFEAGGPKFAADVAGRLGLKDPPALPGLTATTAGPGGTAGMMSNQQPEMAPQAPTDYPMTPLEESSQMSMPSEHMPGGPEQMMTPIQPSMGNHIIDHWNSINAPQTPQAPQAQPSAPPQARSPYAIPGFENPENLLDMGAYGTKRLAAGEALGKFKNTMDNNTPLSIPEYSALQSGDQDQLAAAYPNGIRPGLATAALTAQSRNVRVMNDQYGNPIRVPVSGGKATPIDIPKDNWNPLQKKLNPNEYKSFQAEVNDFDKDKTVADNRTALNNMANVETMVKNYNPALTGPIASRQARAIAGEVGALTDSDIVRQTLDPSLLGRLEKFVSVAATGKLPKDQLDLLKESLSAIKQGSQSRIYSVAQERANRLSTQFGGKATPEELMGAMNLPSNFSSQTYGPPKAQGQARTPTVSSKAQYDALPSGSEYLSSDGTLHRKK
jgi:hypothetical protein